MKLKVIVFFFIIVVIVGVLSVDPYGTRRRGGRRRNDERRWKKYYAPERRERGREQETRRRPFHPPRPEREMGRDRGWGLLDRIRGWDEMPHGIRDRMTRAKDWWRRLFKPRRFHFGLGPDNDRDGSWFDMDFRWGPWFRSEPWWEGPNVCVTRTEEPETPGDDIEDEITTYTSTFINCGGSETFHKCTTTLINAMGRQVVTELYECCRGFKRQANDNGCPRELAIENIGSTLEELGLDELTSALESAGLLETITDDDANVTLFAPTNEVLSEYTTIFPSMSSDISLQDMNSVVMVSRPIADSVVENARNLLLGHVAVGSLATQNLANDQLIETASPYKTKIRINFYRTPRSLVTANCAPISSADNMATNGVVHVVDKVLSPVVDTLLDLVSKNAELSTLKTALGSSTLGSQLREDGHFTVFAPTDSAFGKLDQALLAKLLADPTCLDNILKNHVVPKVICSAVLEGQSHTSNLLNKNLNLTRDTDDKIFVDGVQIATADIMATNGVVYIIDEVLIPEEALGMLDLAGKQGYSEFVELVNAAELAKTLSQIENATVFLPSNEAIQALDDVQSMNQETLQNILKYHVIPSVVKSCEFHNNLQLDTLDGDKQIRLNEYSTFPFGRQWIQTAQCAQIERTDTRGCNGIIHTINKVLIPPSGNVVDVLAQDDKFTTLVDLLKSSGVADSLQENGPFTVFAPTNSAFEALGSDAVTELKENQTELKKILLSHVTRDTVCCAGIIRSHWISRQKVNTMSGSIFRVSRDNHDVVSLEDAIVQQCDITATNGVVHVIDMVLQPHQDHSRLPLWVF